MQRQARNKHTVRGLTVAAAISASLLVWLITVPVAGVEVAARTGQGTQDIGAVHVVVVTAIVGLAGWGLLVVAERRAKNPVRVWTATALTVLVLSLAAPLGANTVSAGLVLDALHLVTAVVLIVGLRRSVAAHGATPTSHDPNNIVEV